MRALAHFSVTVEDPPCLALPFKRIRQHIRSDSILLEGDDGEEYKARLFIRSKSSENIYVAEGWSRFERAHGIAEGDILFCKLLEGPKLKISVAEKTGRQNAQYYTDSSSSTRPIFKKRKVEMQGPDSGSDSESRVLKKRRKGIRKAVRKIQTQSREYSREDDTASSIKELFKKRKVCSRNNVRKDLNFESECGSQSSIWEKKKKNGEARSWRRVERQSRKQLQSFEMQDPGSGSDSESRVLKKKRKGLPKASRKIQLQSTEYSKEDDTDSSIKEFFKKRRVCSRKNVLKGLNSESESGSQSSIWEKNKKKGEARSWRRVERQSRKQLQSLKKKAQTIAEPESSKRKKVLERIHAFESRICNPYQILELTMKKLNRRVTVPKEFALHVSTDNGDYVKLMVAGHEQWKVKWINTSKFEGFGKGWLAFLNKHNLALGDYIMLEMTGPKTLAVHIFFLDHHSSIQGKHEGAYHLKCKSEHIQMTCSSKSEHEQISLPPYKSTCKVEPCTSSMSNSS